MSSKPTLQKILEAILQTKERVNIVKRLQKENKLKYNYRNTKCDPEPYKAKMYNEMKTFNAPFNNNFKY